MNANGGTMAQPALEAGLNLAEEKKTYAVNLATDYLSQHGINVPHDLIDGMIEAQLMSFRIEAAQRQQND